MNSLRSVLLAALCLLGQTPAHAELHALLVGVSSYPSLGPELQLQGPLNDVPLIGRVLAARGFAEQRIVRLTEGDRQRWPTRHNILRALEDMADRVQAGDLVFVYFAGHGSQQPVGTDEHGRHEPDGLFETFLPRDVGQWNRDRKVVHNAIIGYELGQRLDRIRDHGAFVWAVFDSCHSATLARGDGTAEPPPRLRTVSPLQLGIPAAAVPPGGDPPRIWRSDDPAEQHRAGAVYFYAAQTTEGAPELPLSIDGVRTEMYGAFTYALARAMLHSRPQTYRQLSEQILAQYPELKHARSSPLFSGPSLDDQLLQPGSMLIRQWPLQSDGLRIPLSALENVGVDSLLLLVPEPGASSRQALGHARVSAVGLRESTLQAVAHEGRTAPPRSAFQAGRYLRLLQSRPHFGLRLQVDASTCGAPCHWDGMLARLRSAGVPGVRLEWEQRRADAQLQLHPSQLQLEVQHPDCQGSCSAGLPMLRKAAGPVEAALAQQLYAVARGNALLQLADTHSGSRSGLRSRLAYQRPEPSPDLPIPSVGITPLRAGGRLLLDLHNEGFKPVDITVLYMNARYDIAARIPGGRGEINRLEPGARLSIDDIRIVERAPQGGQPKVLGREHLIVISVPARQFASRSDFSFLTHSAQQRAQTLRNHTQAQVGDQEMTLEVFTMEVLPQSAGE